MNKCVAEEGINGRKGTGELLCEKLQTILVRLGRSGRPNGWNNRAVEIAVADG